MLLPSRFQPEALPTPGPAIRKPEPVKADPIREFETAIFLPPKAGVVFVWAESKHAIRDHTKSGAAQASTAAPAISAKPEAAPPNFSLDLGSGEVKVEEPKFRVGDRVRWTDQNRDGVVTRVFEDDGFVAFRLDGDKPGDDCGFSAEHALEELELIPSPPTSDGWRGELVVGKVYLTRFTAWTKNDKEAWSMWKDGSWLDYAPTAYAANDRTREVSSYQDRTVIREATEAELRGEA